MESKVVVPAQGKKINASCKRQTNHPEKPIIPYIEAERNRVDVNPSHAESGRRCSRESL